ncbi:putative short-chain dehydrogenase [Xylaria sp. CBS 124048]|nr:putative short-chain dehydrogenase [Xylaria sp. CBS 124048]
MNEPKGTIILTGANGGLGTAVAKQLSSRTQFTGYHSLYTVRDTTSAPELRLAIGQERPTHPREILSLNVANLNDVRRVAGAINKRVAEGQLPPIRALILNAGFQDFGKQTWTDGFDTTFITNYLGHWLLSMLLLKSMDKHSGRVVVIGSLSHDPHDKRNAVTGAFKQDKYKTIVQNQSTIDDIARGTWSSAREDPSWKSGYRRFGASKLFSIMMIYELQSRLDRDPVLNNIRILGVDPGTMMTGLQRHANWFIRIVLFQIVYPVIAFFKPRGLIRSTQRSAGQVLHSAFYADTDGAGFQEVRYYFDERLFDTGVEARDVHKRALVWKETVKFARLKGDETVLRDWA